MNFDIPSRKILSVKFGLLSEEEVLKYSVTEVKEIRKNNVLDNTIFDTRLGTSSKGTVCGTCKKDSVSCQGHFGHIDLGLYIVHPLFYKKYIKIFLKAFCFHCSRLLVDKDYLYLKDLYIPDSDGINSIDKVRIHKELKVQKLCMHCSREVYKYAHNNKENKIEILLSKKKKVQILTEEIKRIFDDIRNDDLKLIGIDPSYFHPKNCIIRYLPVLPIPCRPSAYMDGIVSDSDISNMLNDIVKEIGKQDSIEVKESKISFRVGVMMDNKQKMKYPHGKVKQCIKQSINGKKGIIREDLQGSRVLFSARTVLGGDSMLETDQIIIPDYIAEFVTTPEIVNTRNFERLSNFVREGKVPYLYRKDKNGEKQRMNVERASVKRGTRLKYGDIVLRGKNKLKYYSKGDVILKENDIILRGNEKIPVVLDKKQEYKLQLGDIVHRHIMDNDEVIFNRQPSLSRGSLMSSRVVRKPYGKTIRIPLAITNSLNADFDGDELNIHFPTNLEAKTELKYLLNVKNNLITHSSRPGIAPTQDSIIGPYLATRGWVIFDKEDFNDIAMHYKGDLFSRLQEIEDVFREKSIDTKLVYTGRGLLSLLLPADFNYTKKNKAHPTEEVLTIYKGCIIQGTLDKSVIGSKTNSIIHYLHNEYSADTSIQFINHIQVFSIKILNTLGYSITLADLKPKNKEKILDGVEKIFTEADTMEKILGENLGDLTEHKISMLMNSARDQGLKIAKESLTENNMFKHSIVSGAKGSYNNMSQITGLLGQQMLSGKRVQKTLNGRKRTLTCYPFEDLSLHKKFESRGFICNSFFEGLTPSEMWFHAMAGREGITDTAVKTQDAGYSQRKLIKSLEDIKTNYDGTTRNANNQIISYTYGPMNFDTTKLVKSSDYIPIDTIRLARRLNSKYENTQRTERKLIEDEDIENKDDGDDMLLKIMEEDLEIDDNDNEDENDDEDENEEDDNDEEENEEEDDEEDDENDDGGEDEGDDGGDFDEDEEDEEEYDNDGMSDGYDD